MKKKNIKKSKIFLSLVLAAALAVGGMSTAFATEDDPAAATEETAEETTDAASVNTDKLDVPVTDAAVEDAGDAEDTAPDAAEAGTGDAGAADNAGEAAEEPAEDAAKEASALAAADYDPSYGLWGGYDGTNSMDDPDRAGACVGWDVSPFSSITSESGLWWIDDYYVGESSQYDVEKTTDFSLKYQIEFHASEDLAAGAVEIVIDASLGTYRNGNNIIPTELGIPYGTPDDYTESSSSPFNYYYIDKDGNILTEDEAKTAEGVQIVVWNYRDIASGSNAMFQVLYKDLDVMQIPDMTDWELGVTVSVDIGDEEDPHIETVEGNTLSGLVDTAATLNSVTKKAYTATNTSYTPELYTESQVSSYINGSIPEPYVSDFDDYTYIVWQVSLNGAATQAYEITIDEDTFSDTTGNGSVVGYKVYSNGTSPGVSSSYGTDADGNPTLTFSSSTQRSFSAAFYVVTAYDADTYVTDTEIENDVTVTVHPVDGYDADTTKTASATTTWGEYEWHYLGDIIGIDKYVDTTGYNKSKTYSAYETLYELQQADGEDTGEFTFHTKSTDRGYALTHYTSGTNVGEWIKGSYYTTTTVDDALYVYPNGGTTPARMLGKDDYYFSSVKVTTTDNGYDIWEDTTAGATEYDGVDQDVYLYAMYYDADEEAVDEDGWEPVATVPFSTSGTMTYTFTANDLARQPYRVKAVHSTANYATYCTITLGVTLRHDSPMIQWCYDEYGDDLDSLKIENLSGVAGQLYDSTHDGTYFQDTSTDGSNYSEKDTETGETLAEFTEDLYKTILMRDNSYSTLTSLEETSAASKSVTTENDQANARVLADYYLTAYEAYYVTGSSTVDYLKDAGISMPARNEVSYYDLLPYGMQFNPNTTVVAGRITSMNSSGSWRTNTGAWSKDGVTVEVSDEDVITNWNNTGRTMVIFHIYYDGDDASAFYDVPNSDQDLWYQGFGIYFQAYYDWADLDSVDAEYNIAAYIAENVTDESEQLLGQHDSTVYKDDGSANLTAQYDPFKGYEDLNGDGITDLYTNMYASTSTNTNIATSSSDNIKKQVRADDDAVAEYGDTAVVGNGRGYTYEISLTNNYGATLSGVVLYDRLEYSVEDGRADVEEETNPDSVFHGLTDDEINDHWTGTFTGVSLTGLTDVGIDPVVYYSADRDAPISVNGDESGEGKTTPADVLTEANGWYTEERFIEVYGDLSKVAAVAVDISKTTDGGDFTLEAGDSLSYQIHMTAPEEVEEGYLYAFNNPSYYSVSTSATGDVTSSTDIGDTVRVELGEAGTVEVAKEFAEGATIPSSMQNARFTFEITRKGEILAGQEYMVYNWDGEEWVSTGVISSTDAKGQFTLRAGQKAVFSKLVDVEDVTVTEIESMFWVSDVDEEAGSDNELYYTFTNSYRSPVYLYKTAETTDLATDEELENAEFTFLLEVDKNGDGEYEPYAGEYIYVTEALTDGSSPSVDTTKGDNGYGYTEDGYVTLKLDDIIAFFPCDADGNYINVPYRITETETGEEWVCLDDGTASGTTSDYGRAETITNYYKYRDLILTKDLSDYDHDLSECTNEWTFKLTDKDGNAVTGNHWYMIDADGEPVLGDNGEPVEGSLDDDGTFSFSGAGSGRRVVIEKLVEGETYILTETNYDAELYEQVNGGTDSATMPTYAITRSITITNKYLLKDLSVEKLVLTDTVDEAISAHEFTFTLEKYNSETDEYEPVAGAAYTVDGVEYKTDANGQFTLKHGETAYFDDVGYQDDVFRITETPDAGFPQIYPADGGSFTASPGSDDASVRFINGYFQDVVSLTKDLNGLDEAGGAYVDIVKGDNTAETLADGESGAPYTVEVTFGVYDGETCVTEDPGVLADYPAEGYPYVYIKVMADGTYTLKSYNGGVMTETLAPYDYIYIAEVGGYTVKASESADMERVLLGVTDDVAGEIGSDEILSEGEVMSGSAAANENIVLVNDISSAKAASEIYKLMTEDSEEVPAGSQITFIVEIYDEASGTWSPASGIKYITMEGCTGVAKDENGVLTSHDTENAEPTSGVLVTGSDGKITLTKTENGYPYIRFTESKVYANVYEGMEDGTLRIVESSGGTDAAWGSLVGYDGEGWSGGPALDVTYADTFYNGNDAGLAFEVEKEMVDDVECDDDFTFYLRQVISASASPITSMDEVLESEAGANVHYYIYDVETGALIGEGDTDANGAFTLKPVQYARFYVPEDTTWYVYEGVNPGYPLYGAEANDDPNGGEWGYAENASIVDETNGVVQNGHSVYVTHTIILTLTDADDGSAIEGGVFTLYKDGNVYENGLTTDKNGQIAVSGCAPGEYYFKETEAPDGYVLPDNPDSGAVNIEKDLDRSVTYGVDMTNDPTRSVRYAVKVWGIGQDTYLDEDGSEKTAGLTFGPATGADHLESYVSRATVGEANHPSKYCIHEMTWDEIIAQSKEDPAVFADCKANGCTKAVELTPNETLFNMTTVSSYAEKDYSGDGVSTLYYLLNGTGSSMGTTCGANWNYSYSGFSSSDPANIYSKSRIRVTLNGDSSDAELKYASSGGESGGGSDLCNESNCLLSCFPSDLQNAIVPRTVQASNSSYDKTTYDKLWLPTISEIGITNASDNGVNYGIASSDSERVAYEFSNANATASSSQSWWSRSGLSSHTYYAYHVSTSGSNNPTYSVPTSLGLSPGFCLPGPEPSVKYAVKVWGICADTYSYNDGSDTYTAGLTFGPALGEDHLESYISRETVLASGGSHNSTYCIHDMSWDEIIAQSKADPAVFADCKANGCTKAVDLNLNDTLGNQTTIDNYLRQGYSGDGVSTLYYLLNYDSSPAYACRWNYSYTGYSSSDPANIYSKSRIRVTLNGDSSDAELKYASSGGESGDGSDLCNESNCLLSCFPSDLQNAIVPRTVQASNSSYDKTTYDRLWLPTISEIGITYASDNGVDYGIAGSSSERIAYEFSGTGATASSSQSWWSRSRNSSTDNRASGVYTSGGISSGVSDYDGLSPGFCIE